MCVGGRLVEDEKDISGLVFVSLMFFGLGAGLLFGRPDVGILVGLGMGFIAMALVKARGVEVASETTLRIGKFSGSIILILIGAGFLFGGISLLLGIQIPWRFLGGIILLAIGLIFLAKAFKLLTLT